ncbi:uncharacterized protein LOC127437542 [Myxocyprinus asiaticus]|uniref:uncharacterized protein LOC127437542 n=1 Tax=Myxocyprinus asiaticus TaxID=70543 RepID=UPI002221CC26|nr:uncharacterized protein LOC127437542 [Myxocyprinus asiaticus]
MLDTHPDWAPSLLLGHNEVKLTDKNRFARQLRRHERSGVRTGEKVEDRVRSEAEERARQEAEETAAQEDEEETKVRQQDVEERARQDVEERARQEDDMAQNPHDHSVEECELCQSRHDEMNCLLEENRQLKHELDKCQITDNFKDDNVKVKYYTSKLCHFSGFVVPYNAISSSGKKKVDTFSDDPSYLHASEIGSANPAHRPSIQCAPSNC